MRLFFVQFLKDFKANFNNLNAYIIFGAYYILSLFSAIYLGDYFLRESEIMNSYFVMQPIILAFIIPSITMRTWAEEIKTGTIEILLTQPISYFTLILAKFFASFVFFILLTTSSLFLFLFSNTLSVLDIGVVISGYVGLFFCGALFTAVGCMISIFNKNNILSYAMTIFILFVITQSEFTAVGNLSLRVLNFEDNYIAFLSGILSVNNIIYFILGTALFLWINLLGIYVRKSVTSNEKVYFVAFLGIVILIFVSSVIGFSYSSDKQFDITDEKRFTLTDETIKQLEGINKRLDITLYESKNAREEANSSYAVFAEFAEKILKLFEKKSNGAIRVNTVHVEPFGEMERRLIRSGISFEEDKLGYKKYIGIELSDNEGNYNLIKGLSNLRQNLLEADIMRLIKTFGKEKKKIAVFVNEDDKISMKYFQTILTEFYDVDFLSKLPIFLPPTYSAVLIINPPHVSTDNLLALEQYVLNGGNLLIFGEHERFSLYSGKHFINFLNNFGIKPITDGEITININGNEIKHGASFVSFDDIKQDIRSILVYGVGKIKTKVFDGYNVTSVLSFEGNDIAVVSEGFFPSNYIDLAKEEISITPLSIKKGKVFFVYDTDLLKDYISISEETKNNYFYELVPISDNMLFFLRLMNYATDSDNETGVRYRHFMINSSSIGNAVLAQIKQRYDTVMNELKEKLTLHKQKKETFYDKLNAQGFASVKNIGDLSEIEQIIDETEDQINKTKSLIASDYQLIIMGLTFVLILVFPFIYIILLFIILMILNKVKQKKIKEVMKND
ncbi:MAG: Gldg family protein [Alphaproteobacteria bacterium]|nr:Gldg family protein [Alphaproteobacteria bacterium]